MVKQLVIRRIKGLVDLWTEGTDWDQVEVSLLKGEILLTDLKISTKALEDGLRKPVHMKRGTVGKVRVCWSWLRLFSSPVQVEISDITVEANVGVGALPGSGEAQHLDEEVAKTASSFRKQLMSLAARRLSDRLELCGSSLSVKLGLADEVTVGLALDSCTLHATSDGSGESRQLQQELNLDGLALFVNPHGLTQVRQGTVLEPSAFSATVVRTSGRRFVDILGLNVSTQISGWRVRWCQDQYLAVKKALDKFRSVGDGHLPGGGLRFLSLDMLRLWLHPEAEEPEPLAKMSDADSRALLEDLAPSDLALLQEPEGMPEEGEVFELRATLVDLKVSFAATVDEHTPAMLSWRWGTLLGVTLMSEGRWSSTADAASMTMLCGPLDDPAALHVSVDVQRVSSEGKVASPDLDVDPEARFSSHSGPVSLRIGGRGGADVGGFTLQVEQVAGSGPRVQVENANLTVPLAHLASLVVLTRAVRHVRTFVKPPPEATEALSLSVQVNSFRLAVEDGTGVAAHCALVVVGALEMDVMSRSLTLQRVCATALDAARQERGTMRTDAILMSSDARTCDVYCGKLEVQITHHMLHTLRLMVRSVGRDTQTPMLAEWLATPYAGLDAPKGKVAVSNLSVAIHDPEGLCGFLSVSAEMQETVLRNDESSPGAIEVAQGKFVAIRKKPGTAEMPEAQAEMSGVVFTCAQQDVGVLVTTRIASLMVEDPARSTPAIKFVGQPMWSSATVGVDASGAWVRGGIVQLSTVVLFTRQEFLQSLGALVKEIVNGSARVARGRSCVFTDRPFGFEVTGTRVRKVNERAEILGLRLDSEVLSVGPHAMLRGVDCAGLLASADTPCVVHFEVPTRPPGQLFVNLVVRPFTLMIGCLEVMHMNIPIKVPPGEFGMHEMVLKDSRGTLEEIVSQVGRNYAEMMKNSPILLEALKVACQTMLPELKDHATQALRDAVSRGQSVRGDVGGNYRFGDITIGASHMVAEKAQDFLDGARNEDGQDLLTRGKRARGAGAEDGYQVGDLTRGLMKSFTIVQEGNGTAASSSAPAAGGSQRAPTNTSGSSRPPANAFASIATDVLSAGRQARGARSSQGYQFGDASRGLFSLLKK